MVLHTLIPALRMLIQADLCKLEASLAYIVSSTTSSTICLKNKQANRKAKEGFL